MNAGTLLISDGELTLVISLLQDRLSELYQLYEKRPLNASEQEQAEHITTMLQRWMEAAGHHYDGGWAS